MMGLTPKQAKLLECIRARVRSGVAPSYNEMAADMGLASKEGVVRLLLGLRERGYVTWMPNHARSIRLTSQADNLITVSDTALLAEVERRGLNLTQTGRAA